MRADSDPSRPAEVKEEVGVSGPFLRGPWWFRRPRELTGDQRHDLLAQVFFEGTERSRYLGRFAILLTLSILLAALGLAENSAPVVIGAMLVSPLTTPLMGMCTSLVLGWPRRQLESVAVLVGATLAGIGLAYLVMLSIPEPRQVTIASEELISRTEPGLIDLAVALAAGAAGAYVLVRKEAIGALPGVAIAVALVPPLAATGMMLELGEPGLAREAFLLYATNLAGIVFAGTVVLILLGVQPRREGGRLPRETRIGLAGALIVALFLVYPLTVETRTRVVDAGDNDDATRIAERWLEGTGNEVRSVESTDDRIDIEIGGPSRPPDSEPLAQDLATEFEQEVEVTVRWIKEEVTQVTVAP